MACATDGNINLVYILSSLLNLRLFTTDSACCVQFLTKDYKPNDDSKYTKHVYLLTENNVSWIPPIFYYFSATITWYWVEMKFGATVLVCNKSGSLFLASLHLAEKLSKRVFPVIFLTRGQTFHGLCSLIAISSFWYILWSLSIIRIQSLFWWAIIFRNFA